ncbi:unnamed protein product [Symbiodinium sp. KB8]|nr:unnamed protein product [Symbiodinium sp. KB8]
MTPPLITDFSVLSERHSMLLASDRELAQHMVAKLCREAIGHRSASLAWASGTKVQAVHAIFLLSVGAYAIALPRAAPDWLEENIIAEAGRIGNEVSKQHMIFQVAVSVLAALNLLCSVMLVLACRAVRSEAIAKIIQETWEDARSHSHFVAVLRESYRISMGLLAMVVVIYALLSRLTRLPHPFAFVIGWSPAFLPAWVLLQLVTFIRLMAALSMSQVEGFYSELESIGLANIDGRDFANVKSGHWLYLLRRHQQLLQDLKSMSMAISSTVLVFQNVVAGSSLLLLWVARACQLDAWASSGYVLLAFTMGCSGIFAMLPLAYITDLCQTRRFGRRSLLALADKYSGWPMEESVHCEYMRFMQHLNTSEAGIYIPTMGLVTRSSLSQLAHQLQTLSINEVCCICPAMPSTPLVLRLALVAAAVFSGDAARLKRRTPQQFSGVDSDGKTPILIEVGAAGSGPACDKITCADPLTCPPGFQKTKVDGHCCPYCINPDIKIEPEVTGATGKAGGKKSTHCPEVWCFPTMCTKKEIMPTFDNGMCCPQCPE